MRLNHFAHFLILTPWLISLGCGEESGESKPAPSGVDMGSSLDMMSPSADSPADDQGSSTHPDMPMTVEPVSSGQTSCGSLATGESVSCQPSQYCADSILTRCESGCLSDMNCTGNETCAKESGQNSGFCQRKSGAEGQPPDDPARSGMTTCGFDFSGADVSCQPSQHCADSTLARCEAGCLSDFNCPNNDLCIKDAMQSVGTCEARPPVDPCVGVTCEASETCMAGQCVANDPCAGVTCAAGQACMQGTCMDVDACAGVSCAAGQVCQAGLCVANDPCADVTCADGQSCVQGTCMNVDACTGVSCAAGQTCQQGQCVTNDPCAGVTCASGQVCEAGQCVNSTSTCIPNATAQDGCPVDQLCGFDDNDMPTCIQFPACDAQNSCDPGLFGAVCSTEFIAGKSPQCLPDTCLDETHCPATWKCVIDPSFPAGFCDTGEFGAFCTDTQDCQPGLTCDSFAEVCL